MNEFYNLKTQRKNGQEDEEILQEALHFFSRGSGKVIQVARFLENPRRKKYEQ